MPEVAGFKIPNHILVGLGGTGGRVLKAFKKRWYLEFPDDEQRKRTLPYVGFLYVDSDKELMNPNRTDPSWRVLGKDVTFMENEFVHIRPDIGIGQLIDQIESYPNLKYLVRSATLMKQTLGEIAAAAGQKRRAGRIMFASKCGNFLTAFANKYAEVRTVTSQEPLHIHVVAGLAGGTGSGSIVDAVAQLRKTYPTAKIDVYAMVPERDVPQKKQAGRYHPNGYAALRELSAMNVGRYLPCDVMTGDEHIRFPNEDHNNQFSLMLYSDTNENGVVIPEQRLQETVAETLFFRIYLPDVEATREFYRSWSNENYDTYSVENDTRPGHAHEKVRTKRIGSFGIKRIVYPEQRILERISYRLMNAVIAQMRYNNFNEDLMGYVEQPPRRDYSELFRTGGYERTWMLDAPHLLLEEPIMQGDADVEPFADFWSAKVNLYDHAEAKRFSDNPLGYLDAFCQEVYANQFRVGKGVEQYYADKATGKILSLQADTIVNAIENNLFAEWKNGTNSLYDLRQLCQVILDNINEKLAGIDEDLVKISESMEAIEQTRKFYHEDYNGAGLGRVLIGALGGRGKDEIYGDYRRETGNLYAEKTRKVAKGFEKRLLTELQAKFDLFAAEIEEFVSTLKEEQEMLEKQISSRTSAHSRIEWKELEVEVKEEDRISAFEQQLLRDEDCMRSLAAEVRGALTAEMSDVSFHLLSDHLMGDDRMKDVAEQLLIQRVVQLHNSDEKFERNKVIGMNVLEQLKQTIEQSGENLNVVASQLISQCGVLLRVNGAELQRTLRNNEPPSATTIGFQDILITMPDCEPNSPLGRFRKQLEEAFQGAVGNVRNFRIDYDGAKDNEITIVKLLVCLPVRALAWLPDYKQEYDRLVNSPNEEKNQENRILLTSENACLDLPPLEGEGEGPKGDQVLPYFFVAGAIGTLAYGKDHREEEGWGICKEDLIGNKTITLLSPRFTGLLTSEELTAEVKNSLVDGVDKWLHNPDLKRSEREAAQKAVIAIMRDYVQHETGDQTTQAYQKYYKAMEAAIAMILK